MHLLLKSGFLILVIRSVYSYECSVCVTQPLITSPVKCPICSQNDTATNNSSQNGTPCDVLVQPPSCPTGQCLNSYNWTTCFIEVKKCNPNYKYRSYDGSCNNLKHPTWGMTNTTFTRILPPYYSDNRHAFRLGTDNKPLPLPRTLSVNFFPDIENLDVVTILAMEWAQAATHDTALSSPIVDPQAPCCGSNISNIDVCMPVLVPKDDYFYSKYNVTCISHVRTDTTLAGYCRRGPLQQINGVSHSMDAHIVYGSDLATANSLRTFKEGQLKVNKHGERVFLPTWPPNDTVQQCIVKTPTEPCYRAGDVRVNQNTQITLVQTLLLREHNRLAKELKKIQPRWSDEKLYQEARNILIAVFQHITYKELLVLYIGKENMEKFELFPKLKGYTNYCDDINLITINSFTTGAFRVGHSGIQANLSLVDYHYKELRTEPISPWMNRPLIVQENNNYDQLLGSFLVQPMQTLEEYITTEMSNKMFRGFEQFGQDLVSLDIIRGRDHGLAPYIKYLEVCTGYKAKTFDDLKKYIPDKFIAKLAKYYKSVEDIDFYVGGFLERMAPGARMGPTFLCLVLEQFYRKKWGDRFWYEVGNQTHSFTKSQLQEIRKVSFSRLLCDNSDNITTVTANSFIPPSNSNKLVSCKSIPSIDLKKWK